VAPTWTPTFRGELDQTDYELTLWSVTEPRDSVTTTGGGTSTRGGEANGKRRMSDGEGHSHQHAGGL